MKALFLVLFALAASPAFAQVGCEVQEDGPVDTKFSVVAKIGDPFTVSWTPPVELADAACTPISEDPEFAVTEYRVYVELTPVDSSGQFPPLASVPGDQTSFTGNTNIQSVRPGSAIYVAIQACNQFGCSALSEQPWMKIGGPPNKASSPTLN